MQDYNYVWNGCMELTLELSCCKYPPSNQLAQFWDDNQDALVKYLGEAHRGVKGVVTDPSGLAIGGATVKIDDRQFDSKTTPRGEYWRILMPGTYTVTVAADGFAPFQQTVLVGDSRPTLLNVNLVPANQVIHFY